MASRYATPLDPDSPEGREATALFVAFLARVELAIRERKHRAATVDTAKRNKAA
jgi:hypothetical protein